MLNTNHSLPRRVHRNYAPVWFAVPVMTVLAAMIVFAMLPHGRGAAEATRTETAATAPQRGSESAPPPGWFSNTEPLPNVQD